MKNFFTLSLLALILFALNVNSQSTRLVLAEEFTQASCPPCAAYNPAFNTLLNNNSIKIVSIKYQTDWPGSDPMNGQTAALVQQRVDYYHPDSVGVPYAVMDGVPQAGSTLSYTGAPGNFSQAKITSRANVTSPFTVAVSHHLNAATDSIFITVDITCTQDVAGTLNAQVAVIERDVLFCTPPGSNGELDFEGVMRDMLPNGNGTALAGSWTNGQTQTLTFATKVRTYVYDKSQLAVVAFIQDQSPCHWPTCTSVSSVLQAGFSAPIPLAVDCKLGCSASSIPAITCGSTISPSLTLKNNGTTVLTSADINYTVDGVAMPMIAWTGSLASLATATVSIPSIAPVNGQRNLSFHVSNPNGQPDINTVQDASTLSFYDYGTVGATLPTVETFAGAFPPLAWRNINPNAGAGWTRSTSGLNGAGSARMYFYGSGAGQVDELWIRSYDFSTSGTTTAQMDFDLAACQYNNSGTLTHDRMEILYSTDCGQTWTSVFDESGAVLAHGNPSSQTNWVPTATSWHHLIVNLDGAVGSPSVFVKFKATSNNGNNCFIDNINVSTNVTTAVPVISNSNDLVVYPNPTTGIVNIGGLNNYSDATITITNSLGALVRTINVKSHANDVYTIDLSNEAKGFYEISVRTNDNVVSKRVTVTE